MQAEADLGGQVVHRAEEMAAPVVEEAEVDAVGIGETLDHVVPFVGRGGVEIVDEEITHGVDALLGVAGENPVEVEAVFGAEDQEETAEKQREVQKEPEQDFER